MSMSLATAMMAFINDCREGKEISRERAKRVALNILHTKGIPVADRVQIALAAMKEWQPGSEKQFLAEFVQEIDEARAEAASGEASSV